MNIETKIKKETLQVIVIIAACLLFCLAGCKTEEPGHICKWERCPYKGVVMSDRNAAVIRYIGAEFEGSDGFYIDVLHIENPTLEYDQLDSLLFSPMKSSK